MARGLRLQDWLEAPIDARRSATKGRHGTAMPPPRRGHFAAVALAFVALALYGSLLPLEFQAVTWVEALGRFRRIPWLSPTLESRSDWVANILLFVPIGFFASSALRVDRPGRLRAIACAFVVIPTCALFSLAIEFAQLWCPSRVPSQNDVIGETLGAGVGVALWSLWGRGVTGFARDYTSSTSPRHKLDSLLLVYLAGFLIDSLLPLDLSISPVDLWRKYRDGKVLLVDMGVPSAEVPYVLLSKVASFVPVGLLASTWLLRVRSPGRAVALGLALGAGLSAAIEIAQLFVQSRVSSLSDCLWGAIGVGVGIAWRRAAVGRPADAGDASAPPTARRPWVVAAVVYVGILLVVFWSPFRFATGEALPPDRLGGMMSFPFTSLFSGSYLNAMSQVPRKVLWFIPLGVLVAFGAEAVGTSRPSRIAAGLMGCLVVATGIELGQIFQPDHFPDLTDILIYQFGATLGLLLTARLLALRASGCPITSPSHPP